MWAGGGIVRGHQADSVHFVCARVCVCGAEGGLGGDNQASNVALAAMIFHDHLHHCEIFLAHFLISFVLNKAAIEFDF